MFTTKLKWTILIYSILFVLITSSCKKTNEGKIVFQSNQEGAYKLYIMNTDGSNRQNLADYPKGKFPPTGHTGFVPSPDGNSLAFFSDENGNFEIYSLDIERKLLSNLTKHEANDTLFAWSPNGEHIAFVSERDANLINLEHDTWTNNIYIMNSDGTNVQRLTTNNKTYSFGELSWSPDSHELVFSIITYISNTTPVSVIGALDLEDTNVVILTSPSGVAQSSPAWSPDQRNIMYLDKIAGSNNIHIINGDGTGNRALLVDSLGSITTAAWSPDGSKILFSSLKLREETSTIYIVDVESAKLEVLSEQSNYDTSPSWSPDGNYIVFASKRDKDEFHLYIMNFDGTDERQVTNGPDEEAAPIWLP